MRRFNGPLPRVIISHDHYDRLNKLSILTLREKADHFIVPVGVDRHLKAWGVPEKNDPMLRLKAAAKAAGVRIATPTPDSKSSQAPPKMPTSEERD